MIDFNLKRIFKLVLFASGINADSSSQRGIKLIAKLIKQHKLFLCCLLFAGLFIGFIEGAAIGLLAFSVVVITGKSDSCPEGVSHFLEYTSLNLCNDYDKYQMFVWIVFLSIGVQIVKAIASYGSGYLAVILRTRVAFQMRSEVVSHLFSLPYEKSALYSAGEKQSLFSNSTKLASMVPYVNELIVTLCVLLVYFGILIFMDWKLFLVSLCLMAAVFLCVIPFLHKIRKLSFEIRHNGNYMLKRVIDYMFALRLVKLYAKERDVLNSINQIVRKEAGLSRMTSLYSLAIQPIQETIVIISIASILLLNYYLAGESVEEFLPGILAFVLVLNRCNARVSTINALRDKFAKGMASVQYVTDLLQIDIVNDNSECGIVVKDDWESLELKKLNFSYEGSDVNQLNEISFSIKRGESVAFVGSSGAGKSTLVDIVMGLITPTSGSISLGGVSAEDSSLQSWRKQFAMVSQNDLILNDTVKANLCFAQDGLSDEKIIQACKLANAHEFIEDLEEGYQTILGEKGFRLSGGQVQRIAFARALLSETPILILDEATSALDTITEKKIVDALRSVNRDKTVIMIAHRLSTIIHADKIFVLESGKIIDAGTHLELSNRSGLYKQMWSLQNGSIN